MRKTILLPMLFAFAFLLGQVRANAQGPPEPKMQAALEIDGTVVAYFSECSGMGSASEIIEHRVINAQGLDLIQKLPGKVSFQDITCRRSLSVANNWLWDWRRLVELGQLSGARKSGKIILINSQYAPVAQWTFDNGWPVSLKITEKDMREELVITVEGIRRLP